MTWEDYRDRVVRLWRQMRIGRLCDERSATCERCGVEGVHCDTTQGEIEIGDGVLESCACVIEKRGDTRLVPDTRGCLVCDACADAETAVAQLPRTGRTYEEAN
jgi:hypothetical protein